MDDAGDSGGANLADEKMRIQADGNVGIGTDSPTYQFHVKQRAGNSPVAYFEKSSGGGDLLYATANGGTAITGVTDSGSHIGVRGIGPVGVQGQSNTGTAVRGETVNGNAIVGVAQNSSSVAAFFDGGASGKALITGLGRVGIGTSNPQAKLGSGPIDLVAVSA